MYIEVGVGDAKIHLRCPRCLEVQDQYHRHRWQLCRSTCPACPWREQHHGQLCPRVIALHKEPSWWNGRMYMPVSGRNAKGRHRDRRSDSPRSRSRSAQGQDSYLYETFRSFQAQPTAETQATSAGFPFPSSTGVRPSLEPSLMTVNPRYMTFMTHTLSRIADFLLRRPDLTLGEEVVTPDMRTLIGHLRVHDLSLLVNLEGEAGDQGDQSRKTVKRRSRWT
jgi:hypothetical protein